VLSIISGVNGHLAEIALLPTREPQEQQPQPSASYPCMRAIFRVSFALVGELLASDVIHALGSLDPGKSHHCLQHFDQQRRLREALQSRTCCFRPDMKAVSQFSDFYKVWASSKDVTLDVACKAGSRPSAPSPFGRTMKTEVAKETTLCTRRVLFCELQDLFGGSQATASPIGDTSSLFHTRKL
jgi:hypothetical protein